MLGEPPKLLFETMSKSSFYPVMAASRKMFLKATCLASTRGSWLQVGGNCSEVATRHDWRVLYLEATSLVQG